MKNKYLPRKLFRYFWDVNPKKMDCQKYDIYIITRLIEHGDDFAIGWMFRNYRLSLIKEVLMKYRVAPKRTMETWAEVLKLDKCRMKGLQWKIMYPPFWEPSGKYRNQYRRAITESVKKWGIG